MLSLGVVSEDTSVHRDHLATTLTKLSEIAENFSKEFKVVVRMIL